MTTTKDKEAPDVDPGAAGIIAAATSARDGSDETVEITLAGHLSAPYAQAMGLPSKDVLPGSKVKVSRANAQSLIYSGYAAGVNPADQGAVSKALGL